MLAVDTYKVSFELYSPVSGKVVYLNQELEEKAVKVIDEDPYRVSVFALEMEKDFDPRRKFIDARTYLRRWRNDSVNICGT